MTATEKTTAACNIIRALGIHPASEEGHTTRRAITKYLTNEAVWYMDSAAKEVLRKTRPDVIDIGRG